MNLQERIQQLQSRRRELLACRSQRGAPVASLDLELVRVRSELLALYEASRNKKPAVQLAS
ncbi:hypothetical protein [Candidatus Igneacidithiobacillus taiwanensis]|uniref:hypothetical protein n=1 Tax=Candidatus Igneacidithiobacillus taiwanensis TaxID=1945924 RepID=UPI00289715E1|nr:hypothetical protein [Candidatus Igneacidithiobacillus taiwanensis]MCE5361369.1 hypothetical protein [Acidithiobacillus sp.]